MDTADIAKKGPPRAVGLARHLSLSAGGQMVNAAWRVAA
jgi:hypothetical protein